MTVLDVVVAASRRRGHHLVIGAIIGPNPGSGTATLGERVEVEMSDAASVFEQCIQVWNAHDRKGWADLFDDGAEFVASGGMRASGPAGAGLFYDTWNEAFPDNHIDPAVVFGAGDQAAHEARFAGTHTGTLRTPNGDVPPTGKRMVASYVAIGRAHNGKVTTFHVYFDVADVLAQLGIAP